MPAEALYDVFLSYARADDDPAYDDPTKSFVRRLYDALTAAGLRAWWDRKALPSRSTPFPTEIERAIHDCPRFLLVVAPGAVASEWVQAELHCAQTLCKAITPILRAGDYDLLPASLSDINMIDCRATRDFAAAVSDVIDRLRHAAPIAQPYGIRKPLPAHYIVREKPFTEARAAICADAVRPTVISALPSATAVFGMGGVGKSTLATALAQDCQVRRHFKDGILWVEVGQTPTVTELQAAVGVHYDDDREKYQKPTEARIALSQKLHQLQALLVLDDVWDHAIVGEFPVSGTQCRLLITTRSRVLADKIAGQDIPVDLLTPHEGARLLAAAAGGSADDARYQQISTAFEGHTLSLELAAARLRKRGAAFAKRLLDGLEDMANPFADLNVDAEDKNLNLEKSLAQSYAMLDNDDLRRRFRLLGIFARTGTVDLAALAAVWGDGEALTLNPSPKRGVPLGEGLPEESSGLAFSEGRGTLKASSPDDPSGLPSPSGTPRLGEGRGGEGALRTADRALEALLDADLIESSGDRRYRQHRLLHAYARALLAREWEYEAAFNRYAIYVIAIAGQSHTLAPEQWAAIDAEQPHILEVGDALLTKTATSTTGNVDQAVAFAKSVSRYLAYRREVQRLAWLEMGLNAARLRAGGAEDRTPHQRDEALFLNELALAWAALGEQGTALEYYEQALRGFRAVGDSGNEATTLNNIGLAWSDLGEQRHAMRYYEQALTGFRVLGDPGNEAMTLSNLGAAWADLGEQRKALEYYDEALPRRRAMGDRGGEAATLNNIGGAWSGLGEQRKALDYYEQALLSYRAVGDRRGEATTLNNVGFGWAALGEQRKALEYYEQALPMMRIVGDRRGEVTTLINIGALCAAFGHKHKGLEYYEQALSFSRAIGDRGGEGYTLHNVSRIYEALDDLESAVTCAEQATLLLEAIEDVNASNSRANLERLKGLLDSP
jgi:tetratricopeptide (TPR) repeat protein